MPDAPIGVVLAAGAGHRFGMPKALARTPEGVPWLERATSVLTAGGCDEVVVVLGAMAEAALHLVPPTAGVVVARDWQDGQSATLRAAVEACASRDAHAIVVTLVDLPDLTSRAVRQVVAGAGPAELRRATYAGNPGHPVLIGRDHWAPLVRGLAGDTGASPYLAAHSVTPVDCTALGGGDDIDTAVGA